MQLVLNEENLRKSWGSTPEYWFSHKDYQVRNVAQMNGFDTQSDENRTAYFLEHGFIPYFNITSEEVMRAFIESTSNKKLIDAFSNVKSEDFVETFWKYFNAYKELSEGYDAFEAKFVRKKAADWCYENKINYTIVNSATE